MQPETISQTAIESTGLIEPDMILMVIADDPSLVDWDDFKHYYSGLQPREGKRYRFVCVAPPLRVALHKRRSTSFECNPLYEPRLFGATATQTFPFNCPQVFSCAALVKAVAIYKSWSLNKEN